MTEATPRITASYLESFQGQTVRILGKVVQLRGDQATIDCGGQISVLLNRESHLEIGHAYEIVGKVNNDLTLKVFMSTDFGSSTSIDHNAYDALVDATHRYKDLFYGEL